MQEIVDDTFKQGDLKYGMLKLKLSALLSTAIEY